MISSIEVVIPRKNEVREYTLSRERTLCEDDLDKIDVRHRVVWNLAEKGKKNERKLKEKGLGVGESRKWGKKVWGYLKRGGAKSNAENLTSVYVASALIERMQT